MLWVSADSAGLSLPRRPASLPGHDDGSRYLLAGHRDRRIRQGKGRATPFSSVIQDAVPGAADDERDEEEGGLQGLRWPWQPKLQLLKCLFLTCGLQASTLPAAGLSNRACGCCL